MVEILDRESIPLQDNAEIDNTDASSFINYNKLSFLNHNSTIPPQNISLYRIPSGKCPSSISPKYNCDNSTISCSPSVICNEKPSCVPKHCSNHNSSTSTKKVNVHDFVRFPFLPPVRPVYRHHHASLPNYGNYYKNLSVYANPTNDHCIQRHNTA